MSEDKQIPIENLSPAPDMETFVQEIKPTISTEIPLSPDKEILHERRVATLPLEFAEAPNVELKNVFIPFDGEWMPDSDPIEIGAKNYKTLQNYRYAGDKIVHLESVLGYTKINTTTSLSSYSYENIRNGFQLRSEYTKKTYVLVHTEHDTPSSNYSKVYQNQTTIPSQGDFESTVLHTDSAYNLEGRFSDAPGSQVAYCNGKESCIWAGEEMRCAGFFTLFAAKIVGSTDISFVDGGGAADTITDGGSGFITAGFKAGHFITVTGTTNNNKSFRVVSVVAATLTLETGVVTAEANQSATIVVSVKTDHINATDYTEALNNEINSAAEAATLDGDTTGNFWLVLSTRPLQGVKYTLRTANATGSASTTCKVWDGDSFAAVNTPSDGTDDSSGSMKTSGTFSWNYSATTTAKPLHFEGLYLYAYLFELSAGTPVIYNVTLDAPFQSMVDVWDGVYRQPIQCQVGRGLTTGGAATNGAGTVSNATGYMGIGYPVTYQRLIQCSSSVDWQNIEIGCKIIASGDTRYVTSKMTFAGVNYALGLDDNVSWSTVAFTYTNPTDTASTQDYEDYTLEVNEKSFADYPIGAVIDELKAVDDILVGFEERMSALQIDMIAKLVNIADVQMLVSYWNGSTYQTPTIISDSTQGLPGTGGANKCLNRTGLLSWNPPDEEDEFRQTKFGVNAYFYKITVNATLTGTEGGAAELVIDTIKGIPAQKVVKPFKFSVPFKNRLMLCGFTEGKEGNRVDYSVTEAPDVYNGEESSMNGIQSLYVGGKDDLTGAVELFNRFGSNIISSLILFKPTETYLLTGDGPENYRLYTISKTIGCPAPLTIAAAETGYAFAEQINRNIIIWMSYSGPMLFDGAAIVPIPGIKTYFDPAKSTRLETSIVERCRGWPDNQYKEYNLVIPSATGATSCNIWVAYDLVRKRWLRKNPGASEIPQAAWPVIDTDGGQFIYAGIDDGNVMRLENGASWADDSATAMIPVVETGDFFPSGDVWQKTRLRRFKVAVKKISEASKNLAIYHYPDSTPSATITGSSDITFVNSNPDTITDGGNGFVTAGFLADMTIHISAGSTLNLDKTFTIATVAAGTLTLISTDEVTAEASQSAKIDSFKTLTALDLDSGHGDIIRGTQALNLLGWAHRLKFTLDSGFSTEKQLHPIGWAAQFYVERDDEQLQ